MVNIEHFFDLYDVFVNELIGDLLLFLVVGLVIIWLVCIYYKIPFQGAMMLSVLFCSMVVGYTFDVRIWIMVLLIVGVFFFYAVARAIRRG